jgi:hypothetical protein
MQAGFNFFLIVAPPNETSNDYLPVLGKLALFARDPDVPNQLAGLQTPDELLKLPKNELKERAGFPIRNPALLVSKDDPTLLRYYQLSGDVAYSIDYHNRVVDSRSYLPTGSIRAVPERSVIARLREKHVPNRAIPGRIVHGQGYCHLLLQHVQDQDRYLRRSPAPKIAFNQRESDRRRRVEGVWIIPHSGSALIAGSLCRKELGTQQEQEDDTDAQHASHRHLRTDKAVL